MPQLLEATECNDPAVADNPDPVADLLRYLHDMGGEEDRLSRLAAGAHGLLQTEGGSGVQADDGLVENENLGVVQQSGNDREFLPHAVAVSRDHLAEGLGHFKGLRQLVDSSPFLFAQAPDVGDEAQKAGAAHFLVEDRLVGHVADYALGLESIPAHVHSLDANGSRVRLQEADEGLDGRGLTRPVWAEKTEDLPGFDAKGQVPDGLYLSLVVAFHKVFDFDHDGLSLRGRGAVDRGECGCSIAGSTMSSQAKEYDVALVGAGPIGIEVAAALSRAGISYVHLEASQLADTIARWPRHARFLSSPERVAIAGIPIQTVDQDMITGEQYLAYLRSVVEILDLPIRYDERVTAIEGNAGQFLVRTECRGLTSAYRAARIVLATGDMNRPRLLGIPGEDLPHVDHLFVDPHRYFRRKLLIVGGRNTAVEAALRAFRLGAEVTISYRGAEFDRKKLYSRYHLEISILTSKGAIGFFPGTRPVEISPREVLLAPASEAAAAGDDPAGGVLRVPADYVLLATGFEADTGLYRGLGAGFDETGAPRFNEDTMETEIPGVYLAGTAVNGERERYGVFIGTAHEHTDRIVAHILGVPVTKRSGTVPGRIYDFRHDDIKTE